MYTENSDRHVTNFCLSCVVMFLICANLLIVNFKNDELGPGDDPLPFEQWKRTQTAFVTAIFLDVISWLWTVHKDKAQLFHLALVINGIPVLTYTILSSGYAPIIFRPDGRRVIIIRYLQWFFTTPAMIYLYCIISSVPTREVICSMVHGLGVIGFGFLASVAPEAWDLLFLFGSFWNFYHVMVCLNAAIRLAILDAGPDDPNYRAALEGARLLTTFSWVGVPVIWVAAYSDWVSPWTEEVLYQLFDFLIKAGISCMIMHSSIKTFAQRQEEKMKAAVAVERDRTIEALKESARMKENFFAAMSHELRTPLVGIIGLADGIIAGSCGEVSQKVKDRLGTMKVSGQRLCSLVNDILDAASLRNDALRLVIDNVSLQDLCAHVIQLTKAILKKGVTFRFEVSPDLPEIRGDARRIKQILHNLLGNAAKFTWSGHIALKVDLDDIRQNVLLSIEDTGVGIQEDHLDRIWGAFNQGSEGMARRFGGTGLGLTIAKELAEAHGGDIRVSSKVGVGSTFVLRLPVKQEEPATRTPHELGALPRPQCFSAILATANSPAEAVEASLFPHHEPSTNDSDLRKLLPFSVLHPGKTEILSVDDDPINQLVMEDLLLPEGFVVTTAMGGDETLAILGGRGYLPDVVLLDSQMPRKHGFAVCKEIRAAYPEWLPVIMVSANTDEDNVLKAFRAGANDFIKKPFVRAEVLARIQTQIRLRDMWLKDVEESTKKYSVLQELQTFIDTANAPIFGIDAQGCVNEWNNKAASITGFTREDVLGRDMVQEFIAIEHQKSVREVLQNALRGRETSDFELTLYTRSQQRVEVLLNATSRRDTHGNIVGVISVGQDITERKRVEIEKARVAHELRTFIDMANAPIFGIDSHGLVNEWNHKSAEITGFPRAEVMGRDLVGDFISEDYKNSVRSVLEKALQGIEESNFEFPIFTKDNRRVEVLLNATARRDVNGDIVGVIGVGQDITEMRRLMRQETLLFQAQAANDAKSQFLATMSHEMRTPLNIIMGMNQLVMDGPLSDEQLNFSLQIKASSESLLLLINDILDLTKIEAGKLELVETQFDLGLLIEDTVQAVASRAMALGLEICCYMNPDCRDEEVIGDSDRLKQIFLNLISNSIKFTKFGEVYVVVEREAVWDEEATFRFEVYDTGIGIAADDQKKLFNRFSQVDSSTTRTYGGTGLGLAISKQFAELMKGSMGVESEAGKGSLFWFTAVLSRPPKVVVEPKPKRFQIEMASTTRCWLVAQCDVLRQHLSRYLDYFGIRVDCFSSLDSIVSEATSKVDDVAVWSRCKPALIVVALPLRGNAGPNGERQAWPHGDQELAISSSQDATGGRSWKWRRDPAGSGEPGEVGEQRTALDDWVEQISALVKTSWGCEAAWIVLCPLLELAAVARLRDLPKIVIVPRPVSVGALHAAVLVALDKPLPSSAGGDGERTTVRSPILAAHSRRGSVVKLESSETVSVERDQVKLRILVAEDDAGQRKMLEVMLTKEGMIVKTVSDGAMALAAISYNDRGSGGLEQRESFDIVLMDGWMPIMSGWEVTEKVRENEKKYNSPPIVIIGLTGATSQEENSRSLDCGMNDVLAKPVDRSTLRQKIQYWAARARAPPHSPSNPPESVTTTSQHASLRLSSTMAEHTPAQVLSVKAEACGTETMEVVVVSSFRGLVTVVRAVMQSLFSRESLSLKQAKDLPSAIPMLNEPEQNASVNILVIVDLDLLTTLDKATNQDSTRDNGTKENMVELFRNVVKRARSRKRFLVIGLTNDHSDQPNSGDEDCWDSVISKPLRADSLLAVIKPWLSAPGSSQAIFPQATAPTKEEPVVKQKRDSIHRIGAEGKPVLMTEVDCAAKRMDSINHDTGPRILIVEDHWANKKLLQSMLRQRGIVNVDFADNGLEALEITTDRPFDIILMDCNMPVMDGWQATERIRGRPGLNQSTPIVAVTANAMKGDREKCRAAGMDDYLSKPVDRTLLHQTIDKWMRKSD